MKNRLFLKGEKQSGKTSLLIRALSDMRPISGGYIVIDLEDGERHIPALVEPREAAADHLPLKMFADAVYDKAKFLSTYPAMLDEIAEKSLGCLDPVLGDELSDAALTAKLEELLTGGTPLMGVIAARDETGDAAEYDRLLTTLENDENTLIIDTGKMSAEEAVAAMRQWAEAVLDKARHDKFDPLMKLRARRRRPEFPPEYKPDYTNK